MGRAGCAGDMITTSSTPWKTGDREHAAAARVEEPRHEERTGENGETPTEHGSGARRRHSRREREERQMPAGPDHADDQGGCQYGPLVLQTRKQEPAPADFFTEAITGQAREPVDGAREPRKLRAAAQRPPRNVSTGELDRGQRREPERDRADDRPSNPEGATANAKRARDEARACAAVR